MRWFVPVIFTLDLMADRPLPPRIAEIIGGKVTWEKLEGIDYELLGYFLSCHLIIEHYLDEMLKLLHPNLDWEAARHTFAQKIALLAGMDMPPRYDAVPAIKHLNSLRNKISHKIDFKIGASDLLPLAQYLNKACEEKESTLLSEPKEILERFTTMVCVFYAGYISSHVQLVRK